MIDNYLVTGANGFIGSLVVDSLLQQGKNVFALVRNNSNLKWLKDKNIQLIYGSLDNLENVKPILDKINYVIHAAGIVQAKNKKEFYKINVIGTINLCKLFKNSQLKKFIYISSLTAAGPSSSIQPKLEDERSNPITDYGISKIEAESIVASSSFDYLILRPGAVFGIRDKAMYSVFKMASKGIFVKTGRKEKFVSMIDGPQLANLIVYSATSVVKKQIINCAFQEPISLDKFNKLLKEIFKKNIITLRVPDLMLKFVGFLNETFSKFLGITPVFDRDKAKDISQIYWVGSTLKLKNKLCWEPKYNFEEAVGQTIDWYKKNNWL
ncbi:NAD(P)-dependent oxidoreductase [Candidatus Kapabacteria bacterium]|nr:NAD(P)-dependent oxidoreductase [Candidatus Kapabacteria bacterium]